MTTIRSRALRDRKQGLSACSNESASMSTHLGIHELLITKVTGATCTMSSVLPRVPVNLNGRTTPERSRIDQLASRERAGSIVGVMADGGLGNAAYRSPIQDKQIVAHDWLKKGYISVKSMCWLNCQRGDRCTEREGRSIGNAAVTDDRVVIP